MGLVCFHCENVLNGGIKELFGHFRIHSLLRGKTFCTIATCSQDGCRRTFRNSFCFRRHIQTHHRHILVNNAPVDIVEDNFHEEDIIQENYDNDDIANNNIEDWDALDENELKERSIMLICRLKASCGVTQSTISTVVQDVTLLFNDVVGHLQERTIQFLQDENVDLHSDHAVNLMGQFEMCKHPYKDIDTDYKQFKFLLASKKFVQPIEKEITIGYASRIDAATGNVLQVPTARTFQYIPIKKVLKLIVESPGFWDCMREHTKSEDGVMHDFHDGGYFRTHDILQTENCLQLILYNDDIEMTNPLSPKAGTHKLGVIYYTIKNVHPRYLSALSHCYLAALYKVTDVHEFGYDIILAPLVEDLKLLEATGLQINCENFRGVVKVALAQVIGDNLGIHSLFGFAQGFTANHLCRKCRIHRNEIRNQTVQDDNQLRNEQNYEEDLQANNLPLTGVRTSCLLNELQSFHVVLNYAPDIMHDMLEGICPLELKLILHSLILRGNFDLVTLNARIVSYNYGFPDSANKPCIFKWASLLNADSSPGQNAAQMWALMRHIALMMGDLVAEGDMYWELLLMLCDCMDIIFAPSLTHGDTIFMKHLISDHHELFLELFPDRHLKPKHHFMLHYPLAARQIGPLILYWSMRFEAKHNFFRRLSHIVCNFKNITKSMAYRHQMYLCYQMICRQSYKDVASEIGPGSCVLLNSLPNCEVLSELLGMYPLFGDVFLAKWANVFGTKYRPGMMVVIDRTNDFCPVFGEITHILVVRDNVQLILERWTTLHFSKHYHAYAVMPNLPAVINVSSVGCLIDHHPLHAVKSYSKDDTQFYISTRYRI